MTKLYKKFCMVKLHNFVIFFDVPFHCCAGTAHETETLQNCFHRYFISSNICILNIHATGFNSTPSK